MKKSLKVLSVLMAALAIGSFAGCKQQADLGDDVGTWKKIEKIKDAKPYSVELSADDADIEWYCWSDSKGQILDDENFNPTKGATPRKITKGTSKTFYFADKNEYRLSFYQKPNGSVNVGKDKTFNQADLDFRGAVKPNANYGLKIKSSNHPEEVTQQAEYWIINDEPKSSSYFPNGDYTINEVWILTQKENDKTHGKPNDDLSSEANHTHRGAKYEAAESLKYKNLAIAGSADNTKKTGFLVPAGIGNVFAVQAEKRTVGGENKMIKYFMQDDGRAIIYKTDAPTNGKKDVENTDFVYFNADFSGTKANTEAEKTETHAVARKITSDQLKKKQGEYWGVRINLSAHGSNKTKPTKSFDIAQVKFDRDGITSNFTNLNGKSAVAIDEVTVMPGDSSEK